MAINVRRIYCMRLGLGYNIVRELSGWCSSTFFVSLDHPDRETRCGVDLMLKEVL